VSTDPSWDDIFGSQPGAQGRQPAATPEPQTRRAAREAEARGVAKPNPKKRSMYDSGGQTPPRKKKRRLTWLWVLLAIIAVLGGGAFAAWSMFEPQIRHVMGWELPTDYEGDGNGTEVLVTIKSGDIGEDVARALVTAKVTMTFDAFYKLLLKTDPPPSFQPGTYKLEEQMSAASALTALQDPANRVVSKVLIKEGTTLPTVLKKLAEGTGADLDELTTASTDLASFGIPAEAPSLEGYLFPATYTFDPGLSPHDLLQKMVDRTMQSLDAAGVAPADRHRVLTIASLAQKEARIKDDFYKVSRVVQNRLNAGMRLEFDSTSHYGAQSKGSVWTSAEERADDNPYNTYVQPGLPIGPIGAPGDTAIDAALHPADGAWLYFVAVNLKTGETEFNNTLSEHNKSVAKLKAWCKTAEAANFCD
jgi:UPF0755 protein